jgi:hypothetical protein
MEKQVITVSRTCGINTGGNLQGMILQFGSWKNGYRPSAYRKCYEILQRALKLVGSLQHGNETRGSTKCEKSLESAAQE